MQVAGRLENSGQGGVEEVAKVLLQDALAQRSRDDISIMVLRVLTDEDASAGIGFLDGGVSDAFVLPRSGTELSESRSAAVSEALV